MSITFTNSQNYSITVTHIELNSILVKLNSTNTYYVNSTNNLIYIRLSAGNLLLVDLHANINRKLFELYNFQYDVSNTFNMKLVNNNNATENTIDQALLSVGFNGSVPISSLESVYMKLYSTFNEHIY